MLTGDFTQVTASGAPAQICPALGDDESVTIYNSDITNTVNISRQPTGFPYVVIQPLTSAVLSAARALYAWTQSGTSILMILPQGGSMSPSPAQIAEQISALGLMKDTTGQNIVTQQGVSTNAINSLPSTLQPTMQSDKVLRSGANIVTVHTFANASRIWGAHLSYDAATVAAYAAGITNLYAELRTGSGISITLIELIVSAANQVVNSDSDPPLNFNPIPVNAADTVVLDVNNNAPLVNGGMRASCSILYSTP